MKKTIVTAAVLASSVSLAQQATPPPPPSTTTKITVIGEGEGAMCPCPPTPRHVLRGHVFLPTYAIPAPFADSQSTVSLGFGYGTYPTSILGQDREVKLGAFQPLIQGQVHVWRDLAISFGVKGNIITGLNSASVVDYGGSTAYAFQAGGLYELIRNDAQVLSVGLDVVNTHALSVSPRDAARSGIQSLRNGGDADIATSRDTTRWTPNVRFAHAFGSFLGFKAFTGVRIDGSSSSGAVDEETGRTFLNLGLGLDADFKPLVGIPVGISGNYRRGQIVSSGGSNVDTVTVGLFETFSDAFNVGLEAGISRSGSIDTKVGALIAKVYYD